jgi:hypothetical protein
MAFELLGGVVAPDPLQIRLGEAARDLPSFGAVGAFSLEPTGVAGACCRLIPACVLGVFVRAEAQLLTARAVGAIAVRSIGEALVAEEAGAVVAVASITCSPP